VSETIGPVDRIADQYESQVAIMFGRDFIHHPGGIGAYNRPLSRASIEALCGIAPFSGRARLVRLAGRVPAGPDYAVAIPVRNEEARLPGALEALTRSMEATCSRGQLIFVVNHTDDESALVIERWA
jgi:hypothetical protein